MARFKPSLHPRDSKGRFKSKGGARSVRSSTSGITDAVRKRKITVSTGRKLIKAKKRRGDIR